MEGSTLGIKMPNLHKCPDWQSNGFCYYDCKTLHCQDCEYGINKSWL